MTKYDQLKSHEPIWDTLRMEHIPFVVVYSEDGKCAVVVHNGKRITQLELVTPVKAGYNFIFRNGGSSSPIPAELKKALNDHGLKYAFLINVAAFGGSSLFFAFHEGFHLITESTFLTTEPLTLAWPRWGTLSPHWDKLVQRDEILPGLCYEDSTVAALMSQETATLRSAMELLLFEDDQKAGIAKAKDFVRLRNARYAKLKDVRVPSNAWPQGLSCGYAEAIMEMAEGGATYVAESTLLTLDRSYRAKLGPGGDNDLYYTTGSFQLLILQKLQGNPAMAKMIRRIAQSGSGEQGIFYEFSKYLQTR